MAAFAPNNDSLVDHLLRNPRIPSPPTLALQIFQKLGQDDLDIGEIARLLALDPGLSAKVLRTLNSAAYKRSHPITDVRQAVTILGNRPLRSLVLGLALPVMQAGVQADAGLQRFWRKSVAGAIMARELAVRRRWAAPDDELAASLLRDLGMILLRQHFRDEYNPVWMGDASIAAESQCAWEESHLGVHHADVGAALLESWQLPIELVEPIRFHHHPECAPDAVHSMPERAYLLNFVTRLVELEGSPEARAATKGILHTARERFSMQRTDLEEFLSAVGPGVEELSEILEVDIGTAPDFEKLLAAGCEELVRVSLAAAAPRLDDSAMRIATVDQSSRAKGSSREVLHKTSRIYSSSKILQYEVGQTIGRGSMGIVVKALDTRLARHVAIKMLAPELVSSEKARQRFAQEARLAASLRHENVAAIHAVDEFDGVPFLVMEYVQGASLAQLLGVGRTFSVSEIARIGRQIALGLAAAHDARMIHRDIKPDNILIEEATMRVRVVDFGLARALDETYRISHPGLVVGTPNFMSPEQVDAQPLSAASDLFSLGSVLYAACTGRQPFQADSISAILRAVIEVYPTPIRLLRPEIPQELASVIAKLHCKNPGERPESAAAVAESLLPWCS